MAKTQQQRRPAQQQPTARTHAEAEQTLDEARKALDTLLNLEFGDKHRTLDSWLTENIAKLQEVLPEAIKGDAARLAKRAMLTFSRSENLQKCTPQSFIRCVLQAAEMGLAIDGKLCHAVPYDVNVGTRDKPCWEKQAQCQPDYKGLIAIAKRSGQIADTYGRVVYRNDQFDHGRSATECVLRHTYELGSDRGEPIGAYAVVKLPNGDWNYELMDIAELDAIRGRSKSYSSKYGPGGPWVTDPDQMRIKTVIRRALKLYCDDPGLVRAMELDDADFEGERADGRQQRPTSRVSRSSLNDIPTAGIGTRATAHTPQATQSQPQQPRQEKPATKRQPPPEQQRTLDEGSAPWEADDAPEGQQGDETGDEHVEVDLEPSDAEIERGGQAAPETPQNAIGEIQPWLQLQRSKYAAIAGNLELLYAYHEARMLEAPTFEAKQFLEKLWIEHRDAHGKGGGK